MNLHGDHPIWQQKWWRDIAIGQTRAEEAHVLDKDGKTVAKLSYIVLRMKGLLWGADPYWTHMNGPTVEEPMSAEKTRETIAQLLAQLPRGRSYSFSVGSTAQHIGDIRQAFKNASFNHFPTKTYLQLPGTPDNLSKMDKKRRGNIERATKALTISEISPEKYIEFYDSNLKARGEKTHTPTGIARDLLEAAQKRVPSQAVIYDATKIGSPDGAPPDAAVAIIMDNKRAYLWTLTYNSASAHPDAIKLLILHAAKLATDSGLIFDTDGFSNSGQERLFKSLRFDVEEQRDLFERRTRLADWFKQAKPLAKRTKAYICAGKSTLSHIAAFRKRIPMPGQ